MNTSERHRTIAEAIQQISRQELNIDIGLENQEWKVYLDTLNKKTSTLDGVGGSESPIQRFS